MKQASSALDGLGCADSHLSTSQEISRRGVLFYRKADRQCRIARVSTPESDRGALLAVSMASGHRRQLFNGRSSSLHDFEAGSVYLRNFSDEYRADLHGAFDFILMEFSREFLASLCEDNDRFLSSGFINLAGVRDPVVSELLRKLAPLLSSCESTEGLHLDELAVTVGTHIMAAYGGEKAGDSSKRVGLSRVQERRARQFLMDNIDQDTGIEDVARECGLSKGRFIKAFRESIGLPPHQWLLLQRIDMARDLMRNTSLPLAQISVQTGFADQSHFSKTFRRIVGISPARLRREAGSDIRQPHDDTAAQQ